MESNTELKRRNISGIYLFAKFDDEPTRQPTCFEDCPEDVQDRYLKSLEKEHLINLAKKLGKTIVELSDYTGVVKE
jgi:hypothetical protein